MRWLHAVTLAFSTYTRIPVPQVKWDDDAMRLAIAFLPLVGFCVGGAVWLWQYLCGLLGIGPVLFAAVAVALPIVLTGGIHMDGYCDTSDALAAWQGKERSLEILKDSRVGAFALIRFGIYILVQFALLYELYVRGLVEGVGFLYVLSRMDAAVSAMTMKNARKDGMLAAFAPGAERGTAFAVAVILGTIAFLGWFFYTRLYGVCALMLCGLVTMWYRRTAYRRFGGVTGDTTGFFLQLLEIAMPAGLLIGGIIAQWL